MNACQRAFQNDQPMGCQSIIFDRSKQRSFAWPEVSSVISSSITRKGIFFLFLFVFIKSVRIASFDAVLRIFAKH